MPKAIDVIGQRYGRLTVVRNQPRAAGARRRVLCLCDCGNETVSEPRVLRAGHKKSCGCLQKEWAGSDNFHKTKHGMARLGKKSQEYTAWLGLKSRCNNPNNPKFKNYGGRGIYVCNEWSNSFEKFYSDMGDKPTSNHSIDRINNDGPYSVENCRWATTKQQSYNRSDSRIVNTPLGKMCLKKACEEFSVNYNTARWRLSIGKDWDNAMLPLQSPQ